MVCGLRQALPKVGATHCLPLNLLPFCFQVITGKCHTASKIRKVTIDATEGVMCDRVAIVFRGLDPEQTIARIKERGEAHKTLQYRPDDPGSEAKMRGVVMGFSRTFEEIQGEELENYR